MVWTTGNPYTISPSSTRKAKAGRGTEPAPPTPTPRVSKVLRPLDSQSPPGQKARSRPGRLGDGTRRERDAQISRTPIPGHCGPS